MQAPLEEEEFGEEAGAHKEWYGQDQVRALGEQTRLHLAAVTKQSVDWLKLNLTLTVFNYLVT